MLIFAVCPRCCWCLHTGQQAILDLLKLQNGFTLKGESQGHNAIFKGLKMTFRTKILKNKLYHVNQHQKYYKLCFDNFSVWRLFFLTALLIAVRLNFSDAPRNQDNLLKLLSALSAIAAPSDGTLQNLCTFLVWVPAFRASLCPIFDF